ncbi:Pre-rRNA-processing protein TSR2 -like protein [Collichthys lucidus]|uniref:Pre-rRNA-processing protein TSR2-like protein n=1 Tax=Collichthys lucidus TaxID=240159 RepID=A0A4U5TW46_COLLU|nr:Pre-rRNA-processing protein TSR2 -like protein [Collichthys lucidus]
MDQEFDTVVDDGSLPQSPAGVSLSGSRGRCRSSNSPSAVLTQKAGQRAKVTAPPTASDDDSDDETQVMESESSSPSVSRMDADPCPHSQDENDGWTVVRKKK